MRPNVCALALLILAQIGCSGQKGVEVTGRVTYNGSALALPGGEIVFVGPKETQVVAAIAPDGTYRAVGVPIGLNRIAAYYANPQVHQSSVKVKKPDSVESSSPSVVSPFLTPAKYAVVDTSGLSFQVGKGTVFDVDLQGPSLP